MESLRYLRCIERICAGGFEPSETARLAWSAVHVGGDEADQGGQEPAVVAMRRLGFEALTSEGDATMDVAVAVWGRVSISLSSSHELADHLVAVGTGILAVEPTLEHLAPGSSTTWAAYWLTSCEELFALYVHLLDEEDFTAAWAPESFAVAMAMALVGCGTLCSRRVRLAAVDLAAPYALVPAVAAAGGARAATLASAAAIGYQAGVLASGGLASSGASLRMLYKLASGDRRPHDTSI